MILQPLNILALDPSTDITGVTYTQYEQGKAPRLIAYTAIDATPAAKGTTLQARLSRIRYTREHLYSFVIECGQIDILAYETDTNRGHAATEAMVMAAGTYLALPLFEGLPLHAVTRQAACIAADCLSVYRAPKGKTAAEQAAKRASLKAAVVRWSGLAFPDDAADFAIVGDPRAEAIADALAIGAAAYNRIVENSAPTTGKLFGPGSRGGKTAGKAKVK